MKGFIPSLQLLLPPLHFIREHSHWSKCAKQCPSTSSIQQSSNSSPSLSRTEPNKVKDEEMIEGISTHTASA